MTKWKPKNNEKFWYINSDWTVRELLYWESLDTDYRVVQAGNCFISREKAEEALNKIKQVLSEQYDEHNKEKELPKLTIEVFDRPDCPEWANYAAVGADGKGFYFRSEPEKRDYVWKLPPDCKRATIGLFDASDWQHSLIERPAKALPDWCKVDNMGWHKRAGYFKVLYVDDFDKRVNIQQVDDKSKGYLSFNTVCNETKYARPRPFNEDEMLGLAGKVIDWGPLRQVILRSSQKHIAVDLLCDRYTAEDLMKYNCTIDGKPCYVLEHKNDKGEWVE